LLEATRRNHERRAQNGKFTVHTADAGLCCLENRARPFRIWRHFSGTTATVGMSANCGCMDVLPAMALLSCVGYCGRRFPVTRAVTPNGRFSQWHSQGSNMNSRKPQNPVRRNCRSALSRSPTVTRSLNGQRNPHRIGLVCWRGGSMFQLSRNSRCIH
jgi:hypothetical protein